MTRGIGLLLVLVLALVHFRGWLQGLVFLPEDVVLYYWTDKERLYRLCHGLEPWSWWDPLSGLGMPRLGNFQSSWLSPGNLPFMLWPGEVAWRFYPLLSDLVLGFSAFFFLRTRVSAAAALYASGFWVLTNHCLMTSQNPPVRDALVALCWILTFAQAWLQRGRPLALVGLALASGFHLAAGNPTHFFFHNVSLLILSPWLLSEVEAGWRWRRALAGALAYGAGVLWLAPALLPFLEFSSHGARALMPASAMVEAYQSTLPEIVVPLASEVLPLVGPWKRKYDAGYASAPAFSVAVLVLVALAARRQRLLLAVSIVLFLQMLGEAGGVLWLLHKLVPQTSMVRAPTRFFFTASLLWSLLAAYGFDALAQRWGRRWAHGVAGWGVLVAGGFGLKLLGPHYGPAAHMQVPPLPAGAQEPAVRLAVDYLAKPQPPPQWLPQPMSAGARVLFAPNPGLELHFFQGLLFSQLGERAQSLLPRFAFTYTPPPPLRPEHPLLRSWGLVWLGTFREGQWGWRNLNPQPARHYAVMQVVQLPDLDSENQWGQQSNWDPRQLAATDQAPPFQLGPQAPRLRIELDQADQQRLEVDGPAALLVSTDNWDPGWHCEIDGRPAPPVRANLALKAVFCPPGFHRVHWYYKPRWLGKALWGHVLGWLLLVVAYVLGWRWSVARIKQPNGMCQCS